MKAAPITNRPEFDLMTQKDILSFYHLQIPRWLFFDKRYKGLSLEAKVIYSFLLNRFQLSRLNNWINADGEIFIIYTRADLSEEIGISYRKAIAAIKELTESCLIWERRCGRGDANQIYLARVELNEKDALRHRSAPFANRNGECAGDTRVADFAPLSNDAEEAVAGTESQFGESRTADIASHESTGTCRNEDNPDYANRTSPNHELPLSHVKNCENGISWVAESAALDMPIPHSSNTYMINTDKRDIKNSLSVGHVRARKTSDGPTDDLEGLSKILEGCDLWTFPSETAKVFENAIERLWFTTSYRVSGAILPQANVRSRLYELDNIRLQDAQQKIAANTERQIKNSTAYVMAVIFNSIREVESDVMADPYLNSLRDGLEGGVP